MTLEIAIAAHNNETNIISLDMPEDTIWSWQSFLSSDGLRDAWSTDIEIPKTSNNMKALGITGVLDGQDSAVSRGILHVMGHSIDVDIVLVSINDETLSIALFEHIIPNEILGKSVKEFFTDSLSSLYQWNRYSNDEEPGVFQRYVYGEQEKKDAAMWHPCKQLNHIIAGISQSAGVNLPYGDWDWYALSTGKKVTPQNARQVIEVYRDGDELVMRGSQHVLNDLSWSNTSEIVFNRGSRAHVTAWVSYDKKGATTNNFHLIASYDFNDDETNVPTQARIITIPSSTYAQGCFKEEWDWNLSAGAGVLKIYMVSEGSGNPLDKYNLLEAMFIIDYSDYHPEDFDQTDELEYLARRPGLHIPSKNSVYWINGQSEIYDGSAYDIDDLDHDYKFCEWDGSVIQIFRNRTGHPQEQILTDIVTSKETFAWFGFYWNLPDISLRDLFYAMGWMMGKKVIWQNGEICFADMERQEIEGEISEIDMNQTLGRKNVIRLEGGDIVLNTIDNSRLEESHVLYSCPLAYVKKANAIMGAIDQYSGLKAVQDALPPHDQMWECDFEDIEGFCIMKSNDTRRFLGRIDFMYDLDENLRWLKYMKPVNAKIRQITESCPDKIDFLSMDGRDFLVLKGEVSEEGVEYECLLIEIDHNGYENLI